MSRHNQMLDVTTGLEIEFCFAAVFVETIKDVQNKTSDVRMIRWTYFNGYWCY